MNENDKDRADYAKFLEEFGLTEPMVSSVTEHTADMVPMPAGFDALRRGKSAIEGEGMFASRGIGPGELIAPARIGSNRTPAGRYTNHAAEPNARFVLMGNGDINMVAVTGIPAGREVTINYRQAASVNGAAFDALRHGGRHPPDILTGADILADQAARDAKKALDARRPVVWPRLFSYR